MLVLALLLPALLGLTISWLIVADLATLERLGLSYALGFGFLTLVMFLLNVLGAKFSLFNTTIVVLAISGGLLVLLRRRNWPGLLRSKTQNAFRRMKEIVSSFSLFEGILIALVIFFVLSSLVISVYWPVWWSDSLTCYDLRAKLFHEAESFPGAMSMLRDRVLRENYGFYVFERPPMTSLVHTWLYLCGWSNPKVFYPLLLLSLALIFYHSLKGHVKRYHALLFTLILVTTPYMYFHTTNSYTNFTFAFYFSVAGFYLYRWVLREKMGLLVLSGVFMGLASWTRKESTIFFLGYLIILLFFSISRRRFSAPLIFCLLYFSIAPLWDVYARVVFHFMRAGSPGAISGIPAILTTAGSLLDIVRWRDVLIFFWKDVLTWVRIVFYLLIFTTLIYIERVRRHLFLFLMVVFNIVLFLVGTYLTTLTDGFAGSVGSARRLVLMFLPTIWYFVAFITAESRFLNTQTEPSISTVGVDSSPTGR